MTWKPPFGRGLMFRTFWCIPIYSHVVVRHEHPGLGRHVEAALPRVRRAGAGRGRTCGARTTDRREQTVKAMYHALWPSSLTWKTQRPFQSPCSPPSATPSPPNPPNVLRDKEFKTPVGYPPKLGLTSTRIIAPSGHQNSTSTATSKSSNYEST